VPYYIDINAFLWLEIKVQYFLAYTTKGKILSQGFSNGTSVIIPVQLACLVPYPWDKLQTWL
jgi:hypothetical protein